MEDGALMGARFDAAIDAGNNTRMKQGTFRGNPALSTDDADTVGNELRTHLVVTGNAAEGQGRFSFGDLLGSGMASDEGANFVEEAVKAIEKVQADVSALLALDSKPTELDDILEGQWTQLEAALTDVFGTSPVRDDAPREEDILDDIADILDALSSEAAFVAATAEGGGGVFASQALGAGGAADAFNRLAWSAEATLGATGSTRYGTAVRRTSATAKAKPAIGDHYGAFSYATMQETQRTVDAAAVSLTGIASYSGGTRAVNASGKTYSGTMDLQVRFKANSVSGVVSALEDSDGLPWQHNFADVDRIVLDDANLQRNAKWSKTGTDATVFYAADSGLLRPVNGVDNTFKGILLGRGADAGSEANGTWSIGTSGSTGYLAGGFGVQHVADTARPRPTEDDGSAAAAKLFSMVANTGDNTGNASIANGMLTVKGRSYGWADTTDDQTNNPTYQALSDADGDAIQITAKFDLAAMAEKGAGAATPVDGPKWVDQVVATLTKERDLLITLQSLNSGDTTSAEVNAWQRVQNALQYEMLGQLPMKMDDAYGDLESESEAIDLINRALDALSSNSNLEAALDPDGTGIFDHYDSGTPDDTTTPAREDQANFVDEGKVNDRTFANMRGEKIHQVIATLGTTSYTRFGAWRRQSTRSAVRTADIAGGETGVIDSHGGPGTFAYSPLDPTNAGTNTNPGFPAGGSASYTGETVAIQNTTILTGTVQVDVSWASATSTTPLDLAIDRAGGDTGSHAGTLSLTISGLASAVGDPLSHGGTEQVKDAAGTITTAGVEPTTPEIADIVFSGLLITLGEGPNAGDLIVGTAVPDADDANVIASYNEQAVTVNSASFRYRHAGGTDIDGGGTASVKSLFVGQGVDGPLGVIGTWTLTDPSVGRLNATGTFPVDQGDSIYGAFGAEIP